MHFNAYQRVCIALFIGLLIYWAVIFFGGLSSYQTNVLDLLYGLMALFAGVVAIKGAKVWGGISFDVGRAVSAIGFGLFLWGAGGMVWAYYNFFLGVNTPYPSLADFFYMPSLFFYSLGIVFLSKTMGAQMGLRTTLGKAFVVIAPILTLAVTYYVFFILGLRGVGDFQRQGWLKSVLDVAYPLGDFFALTVSLVVSGLSFRYMGGGHKLDIKIIIGGLALMFVADLVYSYTTNLTSYSGDIVDLFYITAVSFLAIGILGFNKLKSPQNSA